MRALVEAVVAAVVAAQRLEVEERLHHCPLIDSRRLALSRSQPKVQQMLWL
ncbi:hypothetical protein QWY75_01175 [Pontixanthobacter aestiaquae]|uniref:hypothetical protein n=1 Tax=Pontixanthobacter aestiaquae TaxID=1509367 RepID=UPI001F317157|nr:hypothetical protein [Pontixanthobacter aestiaquae]MDN3644811.1 hypothetical protein [Pontixanthobacter aestiaquae]